MNLIFSQINKENPHVNDTSETKKRMSHHEKYDNN
jgi:hypothetical protein